MLLAGPAGMHGRRRVWWGPLVAVLVVALALLLVPALAAADTALPPGFQEQTVFSGLTYPTAVRFAPAPDPRVFVAEKRGRILEYDDVNDSTATQVINLQQDVYDFADRGLLGLAVDPQFPTRPYLYAMYTRDALPSGGPVPYYGTAPDYDNESCPVSHCTVTGRLVKITIDPATNQAVGSPQVLIDDWCNEYLSHSVGDLAFDQDGQLLASGGDGADFDHGDWGQETDNPCGDPIVKDTFGNIVETPFNDPFTGAPITVKEAEGGTLRSQDLQTPDDPTGLDGSIIRVDPDTGAASPDNPGSGATDPNARRIVAYGVRNPFRFAQRPGTRELWFGDVGLESYEEINRLRDPTAPGAGVKNFGWPCYEGDAMPGSRVQPAYHSYQLGICERLYQKGPGAVTAPVFAYFHDLPYTDHSRCALARVATVPASVSSSISSMSFYDGGDYGSSYDGGLFFGDYARKCIWFMAPGEDGPDPSNVTVFAQDAGYPVDIKRGPGGDLFYVDIVDGMVNRIRHTDLKVTLAADKTMGPAPLDVNLTATATGVPDGHTVSYQWDFNGDGFFGDGGETSPTPTHSFPDVKPGVKVRVRVEDDQTHEVVTSSPILIAAGDVHPPVAHIDAPSPSFTWSVGQKIDFSGHGTDDDETGDISANRLNWDVILDHCPGGCHQHFVETVQGVTGGSFNGVEHEYPSYLTLKLTVTDEYGLTDTTSVDLQPQTALICLLSDPAGLASTINLSSGATPFTKTVIKGSTVSVATPASQLFNGTLYTFESWSDGGARTHNVVVNGDTTLTARFAPPATPGAPAPGGPPPAPPAGTGKPPFLTPTPKIRKGRAVKVGRNGVAVVPLRCPTRKACRATITLRPVGKKTVLSRRSVQIRARKTVKVRLVLGPATRRTLKKKRRLAVRSTTVYRTAGSAPVTDVVQFNLLRR